MCADYAEWDEYYRRYPVNELGWELGKPRPILVEFAEKGLLGSGKALDLCCGMGTNTIYLSKAGFEVTGSDISLTAIDKAKYKAAENQVYITFLQDSFVNLPFKPETFDLIFDMGCFHHVEIADRDTFIDGVRSTLKPRGLYMLTCFSYKNGPAWNHFTKKQIANFFSSIFDFLVIRHYPSEEGDGAIRFFYTVLMKKKP